jgi:hypothetical protein
MFVLLHLWVVGSMGYASLYIYCVCVVPPVQLMYGTRAHSSKKVSMLCAMHIPFLQVRYVMLTTAQISNQKKRILPATMYVSTVLAFFLF